MEGNINHGAIKNYSSVFTDQVINQYLSDKTAISGDEILHLCPVNQVNLFIIQILFSRWKQETQRLKSPYFNFNAEPAKQALNKFMNELSRHILVKKDDLKPIIAEAAEKSILLIFSPYEYYLQEIGKNKTGKLLVNDLREIKKYIKVNRHLLEALISKFEADGIEAVFVDDALQLFNEVCENTSESPEDFEPFVQLFSKISPLQLGMIYAGDENFASVSSENPSGSEKNNINERFKTESKTLLETLSKEQQETIADIHRKQPVAGIRTIITINQRFMFINELFSSNKDEFEMVVNYLDNCTSRGEAMEFIQTNYVQKKNWDLEKEEVMEFFDVIEKKFPG